MGDFLNEFAVNLFQAFCVFGAMGLPTFSIFYNLFIDSRTDRSEHTSIYVAIGVLVTLSVGGLFSWKAMILYLALFALSGLPMIFGEFKRTDKKREQEEQEIRKAEEFRKAEEVAKTPRRRRLPYAANALIEDSYDAAKESQRLVKMAMKNIGNNVASALPLAEASTEISLILSRLNELKTIQRVEE